ncbi:MAG: hypothetical protein ACJ74Z_17975 [Bryobacteraceae bacterium]
MDLLPEFGYPQFPISFRRLALASASMALLIASLVFPAGGRAAESSLAVINGGIEQSEDAPSVPADFQFLPGDFVYFSFQIAGFAIKSEEPDEVQRISLAYEVTPQDLSGLALTPSNSGTVQTELNPEDKNWMPKRRVSFLLPSFVAAGEFRIHVVVQDLLAKSGASKDFPFRIGGVKIQPSSTMTVQNFRFLRQENDREPLEVPAYRPGDNIYASFEMVGYKIDPQNQYHVAYGLTVLRPDGKPFLEQPNAAQFHESSFYPARFIPGNFTVTTSPDTSRGQYIVVLTVRDMIGNQTYQTKQAFSIE